MTEKAFLLDLGRCIGCSACVAACKTGNELPAATQYIQISEKSSGSYPDVKSRVVNDRCYHCVDAACVAVCPTGALFKEDGLTRVNASVCSACEYCVTACPFSIPEVVGGRVHKCDGCADVVQAGGSPWCVKTCPNGALAYGDRTEIMAEAETRLARLKGRYPDARIYGETESGGLGLVMVMPDEPEAYDLPTDPKISGLTGFWKNVAQPASLGLTALSIVVTGLASVIARRNHMKEVTRLEAEAAAEPVLEPVELEIEEPTPEIEPEPPTVEDDNEPSI